MIPTNVHSFSRPFAREHGVTPAILLKHIAYKVRHSKNARDGKRWHYNSAAKLGEKLPYLASSTISANIKVLAAKGLLEIGNYNRRKKDRTQWFTVTDEICEVVEDDLLRFDADTAKAHGVLPAILHYNLYFFLKNQKVKAGVTPKHTMSPVELVKHLPHSESAIKKALAKLVKAKVIVKCAEGRSSYTLPDDDLKLLRH